MAIRRERAILRDLRTLFDKGAIRELSDGQLLERFTIERGELAELAFGVLLERHGPMVFRVCRGVLNDPNDSQDAFQATFLVLVQKARGLLVRDSLGPWLYEVAFRTASSVRTTAARRRRLEQTVAAISVREEQQECCDDLERLLHEELNRLPERLRAPVVLCDLEGRSHEQAARSLGCPVGTIKSRISRARGRLRDRLLRRGFAVNPGLMATLLTPNTLNLPVSPELYVATTRTVVESLFNGVIVSKSVASLTQGVLSAMLLTRWLKALSLLLILGATGSGVALFAQIGAAGGNPGSAKQLESAGSVPTGHVVKPGKLRVTVNARGSLEPTHSAEAYSEVWTTILSILPEGTKVKKGDIVCELDTSGVSKLLTTQKVSFNMANAEYEPAKLTREVAEIALREYEEGIFKSESSAIEGEIKVAESAIGQADARLKRNRRARERIAELQRSKERAVTSADILAELDLEDRIEEAEQTLTRQRKTLENAQTRRDILKNFTRPKTVKALRTEIAKARAVEIAKKQTVDIENDKVLRLEKVIAACKVLAPADGLIVYANDETRRAGPPNIKVGATVGQRQKLFSVFDTSAPMEVNVKAPESHVHLLNPGQRARIKVDAFPEELLTGEVVEVYPVPDPSNVLNKDRKVYTTKVKLDESTPGLRPGLTADAEILVSEHENVLSVPIEAVLHFDDKDHLAVKLDGGYALRVVSLGASNDRFVEVKDGLQVGENVILNPVSLLSEQQKRERSNKSTKPADTPR